MYPTGFDSITIGTARWLASKNELDGAVIIVFGGGTCKSVSYGRNRANTSSQTQVDACRALHGARWSA